MSPRPGLPTPPPIGDEERKEYIDSIVPLVAGEPVCCPETIRYERKMGDTELSYYLPSRQAGVNDMYLHIGFNAPEHLVRRARVCTVWAILRLRHPLLAARAEMHDYDDVRFVYDAPSSPENAFSGADENLDFRVQGKDELIDTYLNGPRTLSNTRLSYLVVSQPANASMPTPPPTPSPSRKNSQFDTADDITPSSLERQYELMLCAMHFLGDGMALHQTANHFFQLLGGSKTDDELTAQLAEEWQDRWKLTFSSTSVSPATNVIPRSLEDNLPSSSDSRFKRAAEQVDFHLSQASLVGGQAFPRCKHPERHTIVPTVSYPPELTKAMLRKCKEHGVSISAALFAVCNVAWARLGRTSSELPMMMYSALNLRPYFTKSKSLEEEKEKLLWDSYWFLAIAYFNVVLPSLLPTGAEAQERMFWHRAREAKTQSAKAVKNKMIVSRTREMAKERGVRARAWGREDDEKENGTWVPPPKTSDDAPSVKKILPARAPASSAALMGLSLLGNLDGMYAHATFPGIKLHTLTTGSRQRHGAMLLFGYTFAGKLWVSLGYDENGFEEGVVDGFWKELVRCVEEFLG
ncbi:uncharacterized protein LAESUDRAFT_738728 [Laetiporus sulphureus 93-53]|uniref:Alcohol acetyltransferase n=1 Tax=Laetiporus sulphureus 93-53 TaxID=1314785 RepID=A0A165C9M1_9APHY|nr:uncharacterized protein LAESUDRAFT_738728 [Laetiporus sulphureus 93-53]KZT02437.1 hypothetical protein LAESUDRAFT_738728 [Laetiporus sulphureus 93-53]